MSKIKLAYIAGPFRGPTLADIDRNISIAALFRAPIAEAGIFPICVHINEGLALHGLHQENNGQWWVDSTLEVLRRCDVVILVPGWQDSEGTLGEIKEADRLGIPVFEATIYYSCLSPQPIRYWYSHKPEFQTFQDWINAQQEKEGVQK